MTSLCNILVLILVGPVLVNITVYDIMLVGNEVSECAS